MRRALALLAAVLPLALAACSVDVEGAPCTTPGTTTECPSGQACGNDERCSARAASCVETRCQPGAAHCGPDETVEECTSGDPVCGLWAVTSCGSARLVCGTTSGNPDCECPAFEGPEFTVDPLLGSPVSGEAPFPTGAASPETCRFKSLADAVARAAAVAGSATVRVRSEAPGVELVFDDTTGDVPLAVPANVTVVAAAGPAGQTVLRATAATDAALVTINGRMEGLRIESFAATGPGIAMTCGSFGRPSLASVAVDGRGLLTTGVSVAGACGADLVAVDVTDIAGPALAVHASATGEVAVTGGGLRDSEVGARVEGGIVTFGLEEPVALASVELAGNAKEGVLVPEGSIADVRLHRAEVHGNGGTGIVVDLASAGAAVTLRGCSVYANGGSAARNYGPGDPGRTAGGILLVQGALPFTFSGNRVYGNAGDQLAFESSSAWSIAPGACGSTSSVFGCVAEGAYAVAIAGGGTVDARNSVWPAVPVQTFASGGVTVLPYCNGLGTVSPPPACP